METTESSSKYICSRDNVIVSSLFIHSISTTKQHNLSELPNLQDSKQLVKKAKRKDVYRNY